MFSILPVGLARGHRGNPAASLRAHQLYCLPRLLSGITTLVLTNSETKLIDQHVKNKLQNLQKLMDRTPDCVVAFLGGHLPGSAILHMRQLSIFGMICHLPGTLLHQVAEHLLITAKTTSGSWFVQVRDLFVKYSLPPPLALLRCPPSKASFKSMVKSGVINFWETKLRAEAKPLPSLQYFKPDYMSLVKPHQIWTSCGSNPFEVNKAVIQARMLSGRYITDQLSRHWTTNRSGFCTLPNCTMNTSGSLEHLLLLCPALEVARNRMKKLCNEKSDKNPLIKDIVNSALANSAETLMQFLLDCTVMPAVITLKQTYGNQHVDKLLHLSRNWCYAMHRDRMTQLGLNQFR